MTTWLCPMISITQEARGDLTSLPYLGLGPRCLQALCPDSVAASLLLRLNVLLPEVFATVASSGDPPGPALHALAFSWHSNLKFKCCLFRKAFPTQASQCSSIPLPLQPPAWLSHSRNALNSYLLYPYLSHQLGMSSGEWPCLVHGCFPSI